MNLTATPILKGIYFILLLHNSMAVLTLKNSCDDINAPRRVKEFTLNVLSPSAFQLPGVPAIRQKTKNHGKLMSLVKYTKIVSLILSNTVKSWYLPVCPSNNIICCSLLVVFILIL